MSAVFLDRVGDRPRSASPTERSTPRPDVDPRLADAMARIPLLAGVPRSAVRVERLESYTNSNYRLDVAGERMVLRLPGTGTGEYIDRQVEDHNARIATAAGLNADVLFFDPVDGTMLSRWITGVTTTAELLRRPAVTERAALALQRTHRLTPAFCGRYDAFDVIAEHVRALDGGSVPLPAAYERLAPVLAQVEAALAAAPVPSVPCHNDPYPGNLIDTGAQICLIDWEYSGLGDPMWDLGDLSVEAGYGPEEDGRLLRRYYDGSVPAAAPHRLALYKFLSDFCWGVWSFVQIASGNAAVDYWEYGTGRFAHAELLVGRRSFAEALAGVAAD